MPRPKGPGAAAEGGARGRAPARGLQPTHRCLRGLAARAPFTPSTSGKRSRGRSRSLGSKADRQILFFSPFWCFHAPRGPGDLAGPDSPSSPPPWFLCWVWARSLAPPSVLPQHRGPLTGVPGGGPERSGGYREGDRRLKAEASWERV